MKAITASTELKACEDDGIVAYVPVPEGAGRLGKKLKAASASTISVMTRPPMFTVVRPANGCVR